MTLRTEYEFTLPRGYVDSGGSVHREGIMRLATARDELEPLRNPTVSGPDDPRLTVLILARVVTKLGDVPMVTSNEIEGLFAVDLAFLQDFYGVINFGTQEEYEEFLAVQADAGPAPGSDAVSGTAGAAGRDDSVGRETGDEATDLGDSDDGSRDGDAEMATAPRVRARVEEIPRSSK